MLLLVRTLIYVIFLLSSEIILVAIRREVVIVVADVDDVGDRIITRDVFTLGLVLFILEGLVRVHHIACVPLVLIQL